MSNELEPKPTPSQPVVYQIGLKGHLGSQWTDWFEGLTITLEEDGDTLLTGSLVDQSALHGLLKKVRDLGMSLVSVVQVQFNETHQYSSKKEKEMNTNRMNAAIVGVLFIIATVAGTIAATITKPILDAPDYLTKIAANEGTIIIGAFLAFLMAISCAGIGLGLYPIMKKYSAGMAIGTVGFRVIESMIQILEGVSMIALLALSQEFVKTGAPDAAYFQTISGVIKAGEEWLSNGVMLLCWCIGAFMYYSLFYQYRLVPHWLSGWGLVGITLTIISSVLVLLHVIPGFGTIQVVANLPIALQEMVFAVWLIAKGYSTTEVAT